MADPPVAVDGAFEIPGDLVASLVFVRHGESTFIAEGRFQGRLDPPLSPLGIRQAELVAQRLARRDRGTPLPIPAGPPVGVWHSPLARAAQTAGTVAGAQSTQVPLNRAEPLTEIAQGDWEGLPADEVRTRWPDLLARWRATPTLANAPGGERLVDAALRVRQGLGEILTSLRNDNGVAGRSAADDAGAQAALRREPVPGYPSPAGADSDPWAILVAHDGIFRLSLMTLLDVPYERFWSFPFNLCAITVVALSQGIATLRAHNLADHLAPLADWERAEAEARGDRRGAL